MNPKPPFLALFIAVVVATVGITIFFVSPRLEKYTSHRKPYANIRESYVDVTTVESPGYREALTKSADAQDSKPTGTDKAMNVLFIIVDDLRPQLGVYHDPGNPDYFGKVRMYTPNIDKFASRSIVFTHAYAQYSLCGPSRTSLLTSRRPDVTRVYGNKEYWREVGGNFTTLPQHFKNNGYFTVGIGKVFHPGASSNNDDPPSWTTPYYHSAHRDRYFLPKDSAGGWFAVPKSEMEKVPLVDMISIDMAKVILADISLGADKKPFFMAIGFNKPHLSMVCPDEYFEKYPLEEEGRFLANATWHKPFIRPSVNIDGIETEGNERILPPDVLRYLRRAYFACISYVDDLFGQVLHQLEETGLDNTTIISFMADHGFHMGENRHWGKVTTWEFANRVPMMIRIPGVTDDGIVSSTVVESIDIFPTLVEAAGLEPLPVCPRESRTVRLCTQGISLMPLIWSPNEQSQKAAFSQVIGAEGMRYTIRTKRYRLVECALVYNNSQPEGGYRTVVEWRSHPNKTELYDHDNDKLEQVNLINDPQYEDIITKLRQQLHQFVEGIVK